MTPIKFKSNLPQILDGAEDISRAVVEALAEEAVKAARRRVVRDTGATARSIGYELRSATRARVGAEQEAGLWLEIRRAFRGSYKWLGPALDETEVVARAIALAAARYEAAKVATKTRL